MWGTDSAGPDKAVDGNPSMSDRTCAHTQTGGDSDHAWWLVDLEKTARIRCIHYLNTRYRGGKVITIYVCFS